jgi:hypothetical protein
VSNLWVLALKQAVSSASAVVLTNLADPGTVIFSWPWFRHMLIAMFLLTLFNEARYWKEWADNTPPTPLATKLQQASESTKQATADIEDAKAAAPPTEK